MLALNHATRRRLQKLRQVPSVWEGDRQLLPVNFRGRSQDESNEPGACILWVDGSQGVVRAMDIVDAQLGSEVVVRTLLQAMEHPQGNTMPARPQKIVVRDRELQFFLRGVLQDLDITVDYAPELPLIQEIFRGLQEAVQDQPPPLPPEYADLLEEKASQIWQVAPWDYLADHQILAIELKQWDLDTLYVSIMGLLGMEYGILLYRSLESLRQFRQQVMGDGSLADMEAAFLKQDCLFLTYEPLDEELTELEDLDLASLPFEEIQPSFGNLHPLEGIRSFLYEEEAIALFTALDGLHRFFQRHHNKLRKGFPALTSRLQIPLLATEGKLGMPEQLSITVSTQPELAAELQAIADEADEADLLGFPPQVPLLNDDLIPEDAFFSLGAMPWEIVEKLRLLAKHYQPGSVTQGGDDFPIILIQTSQPKGKDLISALESQGGVKAICFNPGEDSFGGERYDLGIIQTQNNKMHLFGEFLESDPTHVKARKKWDNRCKQTKGWCGLVIARGLKGASRGNPQLRDMMAFYEVRSQTPSDLGLGTLQLMPRLDWD
jgi:hypothetical protein